MQPIVSILIPAYNTEKWIGDTIRSALAQTWPKKEIIVVDDGSRDNTLAIARRFSSPIVSVVTQENQGAAAARNQAFARSQGEFIQWLDADDLLSPDKIDKQMQVALGCGSKRTLLSSSWGSFMYRSSKAKFEPTPLWQDLSPVEWLIRKWENKAHMQTATWLVSRELTKTAGPFDTRLMGDDDGEYFCRVIKHSDGIRFVPGAKLFYRITDSRRWSYIGSSNKKIDAQFLGMKLQIDYLRSMEDSERVRAACVNYLQTCLWHFYPNRPDLMDEAQQLAGNLGGKLDIPKLSWKYTLIDHMLGRSAAKRAQLQYNQYKISLLRAWDKAWFRLES